MSLAIGLPDFDPRADNGPKGARAELIAAAWLLEKGFQIFRNVSPSGPVDLVAYRDGKLLMIDVKAVYVRVGCGRQRMPRCNKLKPKQEMMGVVQLHVSQDGVCAFDIGDLEMVYEKFSREPAEAS